MGLPPPTQSQSAGRAMGPFKLLLAGLFFVIILFWFLLQAKLIHRP
jgi:hypothetical protein